MVHFARLLAPPGVKRGLFGEGCSGKCHFPGCFTPCAMCCTLVQGHSFAFVYLRHHATPSVPPLLAALKTGPCVSGPEPELRVDRF